MKKIHILLRNANKPEQLTGFTGYYIVASFISRTSDGLMSSGLKVELDDDGYGIMYLPPNYEIDNDIIHFEFYGPGGYWVAPKETVSESNFSKSNTKETAYNFRIDLLTDKKLNKSTYPVKGRLVDISGQTKIAKKQFFVIQSEVQEVTDKNYKIIETVTTDLEGYFKFELQLTKNRNGETEPDPTFYFAFIPDSEDKIVPLRKVNGFVEGKQILGVNYVTKNAENAEGSETNDCNCENTPRLPSPADYGSIDGAFSQDLGVGCVEFTKANRVIEEYQFIQVVRTTDPEIKKVNLTTNTFKEILDSLEKESFIFQPQKMNILLLPGAFTINID